MNSVRSGGSRLIGWALVIVLGALAGCAARQYAAPEQPMPPNTILLSVMMRQLSVQPGFTETMLRVLGGADGSKNGPALLTPKLVRTMRELILGKNWSGLDRFPGWTMREINPTVRVASHVVGKDQAAGAQPEDTAGVVRSFLDLGTLSLTEAQTVDLNRPSQLPGFAEKTAPLGYGVVRGDGPDPAIAPMHSESDRLALLLNRLSLNGVGLAGPGAIRPVTARVGKLTATTPEALIEALAATGHQVTVADARYFANFGHFHYTPGGSNQAEDVMMPFWVNSQIEVPGTGRPLLVPVIHAEYEWFIRGPKVNADVAFYFGIDGKAEFRTMDELNQPWVLGRHAHEYRGPEAREVTRLTGRMVAAYMHEHLRRPALPFGGYYALGVCQDSIAAIEKKMTGEATLFPNTADTSLFDDPRDAEVNQLMEAIPKDRLGAMPDPQRIFASLPTENYAGITIPGLANDLTRTRAAWQSGHVHRVHGPLRRFFFVFAIAAAGLIALGVLLWHRRRRSEVPA